MEKIKGYIGPVIGGVLAGMALLSFGFGFVSGSTATEMAEEAAENASVVALTPICVANAKADPEGLAQVMAMSSYSRRNGVSKAGWPVYPEGANSSLQRAIDQGCADGLK